MIFFISALLVMAFSGDVFDINGSDVRDSEGLHGLEEEGNMVAHCMGTFLEKDAANDAVLAQYYTDRRKFCTLNEEGVAPS